MPQLLRDNFQGNTQSDPSARRGVSQLMKSESFNFCQRAGAAHSFLLAIFGPGLATFAEEHCPSRITVGAHVPEKSHSLRVEVYVPLLTALRLRDEKRARRRIEIAGAQPAQFSIPGSCVQASPNKPLKVLLFRACLHKIPLILLA